MLKLHQYNSIQKLHDCVLYQETAYLYLHQLRSNPRAGWSVTGTPVLSNLYIIDSVHVKVLSITPKILPH